MSFLEYGNKNNPKDIGTLAHDTPIQVPELTPKFFIWPIIAFIIICLIEGFILAFSHSFIETVIFGFYLTLSAVFAPKPNLDDIGFAGGLIDHPFKITDDINRHLLGIKILLAPGKFLINPIKNLIYSIIVHNKSKKQNVD